MEPLIPANPLRNGGERLFLSLCEAQWSILDGSGTGGPGVTQELAAIEYGDEPPILVFGDRAGLERACRGARLAGCRIAAADPVAAALTRLDRQAATYPALVELGAEAAGEALVPLLERLRDEAESQGRPSVVVAPPALIDLVAARAGHQLIGHLCDPTESERIAAIAAAARPRPARLHDIGREKDALLLQLADEMGRIANVLASLTADDAAATAPAAPRRGRDAEEAPVDPAFIRTLIRARRLRDQYLRGELFADPAWDMMLDLMAARLEQNRVAVSSLCIAAAVPPTTALRWIKALTDRGIFVRRADPSDGRRVYIELSDETARALGAYLRAVQRIAPTAV